MLPPGTQPRRPLPPQLGSSSSSTRTSDDVGRLAARWTGTSRCSASTCRELCVWMGRAVKGAEQHWRRGCWPKPTDGCHNQPAAEHLEALLQPANVLRRRLPRRCCCTCLEARIHGALICTARRAHRRPTPKSTVLIMKLLMKHSRQQTNEQPEQPNPNAAPPAALA